MDTKEEFYDMCAKVTGKDDMDVGKTDLPLPLPALPFRGLPLRSFLCLRLKSAARFWLLAGSVAASCLALVHLASLGLAPCWWAPSPPRASGRAPVYTLGCAQRA